MVPILANTITADMGMIPGCALISPALGLPLSVLAAFLERPFYTLGGISRKTIWYSLQANLVSLLVGYVGLFAAILIGDASNLDFEIPFSIWPICAVAVSIIVEGRFLARRQQPNRVFWMCDSVANVFSAAVCVGILFPTEYVYTRFPRWKGMLEPWNLTLNVFAFIGSILVYLLAFLKTRSAKTASPANLDSRD
jgi:hypothetical protein